MVLTLKEARTRTFQREWTLKIIRGVKSHDEILLHQGFGSEVCLLSLTNLLGLN